MEALVVKARLGDDVRKAAISNGDMSRDELLLMLQRWFKGKLSNHDNVALKYKDDDGDLITIQVLLPHPKFRFLVVRTMGSLQDDSDLTFAIRSSSVLRVYVSVGAPTTGPFSEAEAAEVPHFASSSSIRFCNKRND